MFWKTLLSIGLSLATPCAARAQSSLADDYREAAGRVIGAAMTDVEGFEKLEHLTIDIGHRLSGSFGLERSIDWAFDRMEREELHVRKLPVKVPHWVRGEESARLITPVERPLPILGLGLSVGTPAGGITAPVVAVTSFEELEALGREKVEGKIVLYAVPWMGYGRTVRYRSAGASRAAALGAVAALVRSATGRRLDTPIPARCATTKRRLRSRRPPLPSKMPNGCDSRSSTDRTCVCIFRWALGCFRTRTRSTSSPRSRDASFRTRWS